MMLYEPSVSPGARVISPVNTSELTRFPVVTVYARSGSLSAKIFVLSVAVTVIGRWLIVNWADT